MREREGREGRERRWRLGLGEMGRDRRGYSMS